MNPRAPRPNRAQPAFFPELYRLLNTLVNRLFSLHMGPALLRLLFFVGLFLWLWFRVGGTFYTWNPDLITIHIDFPDKRLALPLPLPYFFNAGTLRILVAILFPFFFMLYRAGLYLDDVFELDNPRAGVRFVTSAVFGIGYDTLVLREGQVQRESRISPVFTIGGPGYVRVELDTAAVFETIDGRPHVIGPTRRALLDGFERLRATYDLRDHIYPGFTVDGRTLDGVPIQARNVTVRFSVFRGNQEQTLKQPYPFDPQALIALTYTQSSRVMPGQAGGQRSPWTTNARMHISNRLRDFIRHTPLGDFLVNIDLESLIDEENTHPDELSENTQEMIQWADDMPGRNYTSRRAISGQILERPDLPDQFVNFARQFNRRAQRSGLEIEWSGIGTWHPPAQTIRREHIDAWRIARSNLIRIRPAALRQLRRDTRNRTIQSLLHNYLFASVESVLVSRKFPKKVLRVLHSMLETVGGALFPNNLPPSVQTALNYLRELSFRYVQPSQPDVFETKEVEQPPEAVLLYQLISKRISKNALREMMQALRQQQPEASNLDLLTQIANALLQVTADDPNLAGKALLDALRRALGLE